MKDFGNVINLIAVINVLEIIAIYQKWGQREKASAFERKVAINKLKNEIKNLDDRNKIEKIVDEKFAFVDFDKKMMRNCGENFMHVPKSKTKFIDSILKSQN